MLTTSKIKFFCYIFVLLDAFILLELCKQNLSCILQLITMHVLLFGKCVDFFLEIYMIWHCESIYLAFLSHDSNPIVSCRHILQKAQEIC